MCCTMLGQIIFMAVMFVGLVLTCVSMFTPGWKAYKATHGVDQAADNIKDHKFGIIICNDDMFPKPPSSSATTVSYDGNCEAWWKNRPTWEKVVIGCMGLAVITQVIAFVWTLLTFCACCCKRYLTHPLPPLAGLAAIFLIIAIAVFAGKYKDSLDFHINNYNTESSIGYSFYVACVAALCMILDCIIGCVVVRVAKTPF